MKVLRYAACVLLAAASMLASPSYSASFSTDQSDLWFIPEESGWGIQLVQRGSVIFATMFVYGPSNAPTWYTATMNPEAGALTWSGDLYATTGPYFATVPFDPHAVGITKVGTMTWKAQSVTAGTLTYNVGNITVVKNVTRQTLVFDDYSGHYAGGIHTTNSGCLDPTRNGTIDFIGVLDITHSGSTINISLHDVSNTSSCSFGGTYSQAGQFGAISGTYTCGSDSGTLQAFELQVNITGFTGRFTSISSTQAGCQATGWVGGLHVTTF